MAELTRANRCTHTFSKFVVQTPPPALLATPTLAHDPKEHEDQAARKFDRTAIHGMKCFKINIDDPVVLAMQETRKELMDHGNPDIHGTEGDLGARDANCTGGEELCDAIEEGKQEEHQEMTYQFLSTEATGIKAPACRRGPDPRRPARVGNEVMSSACGNRKRCVRSQESEFL